MPNQHTAKIPNPRVVTSIRWSRDELRKLATLAKAAKLSVSEYVRLRALA